MHSRTVLVVPDIEECEYMELLAHRGCITPTCWPRQLTGPKITSNQPRHCSRRNVHMYGRSLLCFRFRQCSHFHCHRCSLRDSLRGGTPSPWVENSTTTGAREAVHENAAAFQRRSVRESLRPLLLPLTLPCIFDTRVRSLHNEIVNMQ